MTEGLFDLDDNVIMFALGHEVAHHHLGHVQKAMVASYATTGVMMAANVLIPGAGLLNHLINPAVVNNYSKEQEQEADMLAYKICVCAGVAKDDVVSSLRSIKLQSKEGGGFWDKHPSWDERIAAIEAAQAP